ncbi:putative bifunctional diguanylate cyclase/phosphodiesterase [Frateuria aurantia]
MSLVVLSLLVAALASYTTLDVSGRIVALRDTRRRQWWLGGGALAMGSGIWAMHFVGMLAFSLPIRLAYDPWITMLSLCLAIAVSYFALRVIVRPDLPLRWLAGSAVLMAAGICGMHYTGMAAMEMVPGIQYRPVLVGLSMLVALAASFAALAAARQLNGIVVPHLLPKRIGVACVMAVAITGMHYTGMAAAYFPPGSICGATHGLGGEGLAAPVTAVVLLLLAMALLSSRLDASNQKLAGSVDQLSGQMVRMAALDMLTELPNRRTLMEHVGRLIQDGPAHGRFAVLFMDLDGFKTINDSLGHTAGDQVLKAFASRLQQCFRKTDMVARIGGDEFVVVLDHLPAPEVAAQVVESMLARMWQGAWRDGVSFQVIPSVGIALYPQDGENVEILLKNADIAMYEAKRAGRGTYRFFDWSMNHAAARILQIQQGLHEAVAHGAFSLNYQPKFSTDGARLLGAEALLRYSHPELGVLSPQEFIGIAERSGLIVQIGEWVVRQTCRQLRHWRSQGIAPLKVAINLSPRQLIQPDLLQVVLDIVQEEQVLPDWLMFEITETVAMQDAARTVDTIHAFQQAGFDVAIDDFGMGYSSLAYLQRFRVRQLKIDGFFIRGLDAAGEEGEAMVAAIIALAHSLGMEVVAEGVETTAQQEKLKTLGCDQIQGYLLGRPMPEAMFAGEIEAWRAVS